MRVSKAMLRNGGSTFTEREIEVWEGRALGQSTALALKYIAEAMQNPHREVKVRDHVQPPTHAADRHLLEEVIAIADTLVLDWLRFNRTYNTISYHPTVELEEIKMYRVKQEG